MFSLAVPGVDAREQNVQRAANGTKLNTVSTYRLVKVQHSNFNLHWNQGDAWYYYVNFGIMQDWRSRHC